MHRTGITAAGLGGPGSDADPPGPTSGADTPSSSRDAAPLGSGSEPYAPSSGTNADAPSSVSSADTLAGSGGSRSSFPRSTASTTVSNPAASPWWPYLLILLAAAFVSLPLLLHGPSCGHDFDFHLQSWLAVRDAWRAGLLSPHWIPAANYGAGEPRLVFYPPFSWTLGALLGALLPWQAVPAAFTFLALAGAGASFYHLARPSITRTTATAAACLYLANPYLLFVAYERTAYGELLAAAWMPLILLYALRPRPPIARLSLVVAALWFTNAPAAVMACYLLALCALAAALATRSVLPALRAFAALALGSSLAAVYLVPAWYEQRWVEIARVIDPGMRIEDSFLFAHTGQPYHDQVLHTASLLAVWILGAGFASLAASRLLQRTRTPDLIPPASQLPLLPAFLLTLLAAILFLLLPISDPLWRHAPQLHFLQFPWRWLLVAGLAAALAAGTLLGSLFARLRTAALRSLLPVASLLLLVGAWAAGRSAYQAFAQPCDDEDNVTAQQALLAPANGDDPPGFEGTDEYTPSNADNGEIQQGLPAARLLRSPDDDEGDDSTTPNPDWQAPTETLPGKLTIDDQSPEHRFLTVVTPAPAWLVLRLLDYPAWQLRVNGKPLPTNPRREDGLLTLPVSRGTTRIEITWHATPDVLAGRALSLLTLLAFTLLAARRSRLEAHASQHAGSSMMKRTNGDERNSKDGTGRTRNTLRRP